VATKSELQSAMKNFGFDLNPFTSKETLVNLLRLHVKALEQGVDVPKLNDHELRTQLNKHQIVAGPVINLTRAIYQRKLLEAVTNESGEGADDDLEQPVDDEFHTPPIAEEGMTTRSGKTFFYEPKHQVQ